MSEAARAATASVAVSIAIITSIPEVTNALMAIGGVIQAQSPANPKPVEGIKRERRSAYAG